MLTPSRLQRQAALLLGELDVARRREPDNAELRLARGKAWAALDLDEQTSGLSADEYTLRGGSK